MMLIPSVMICQKQLQGNCHNLPIIPKSQQTICMSHTRSIQSVMKWNHFGTIVHPHMAYVNLKELKKKITIYKLNKYNM